MMNGQKYHALTRKMNETNFILEPLHVFATAPVITELGAKFHLEEEFVAFGNASFLYCATSSRRALLTNGIVFLSFN